MPRYSSSERGRPHLQWLPVRPDTNLSNGHRPTYNLIFSLLWCLSPWSIVWQLLQRVGKYLRCLWLTGVTRSLTRPVISRYSVVLFLTTGDPRMWNDPPLSVVCVFIILYITKSIILFVTLFLFRPFLLSLAPVPTLKSIPLVASGTTLFLIFRISLTPSFRKVQGPFRKVRLSCRFRLGLQSRKDHSRTLSFLRSHRPRLSSVRPTPGPRCSLCPLLRLTHPTPTVSNRHFPACHLYYKVWNTWCTRENVDDLRREHHTFVGVWFTFSYLYRQSCFEMNVFTHYPVLPDVWYQTVGTTSCNLCDFQNQNELILPLDSVPKLISSSCYIDYNVNLVRPTTHSYLTYPQAPPSSLWLR